MSAVGFPRNLRGPVVSARYTGARGSRLIQVPLACGGCARPPAGGEDEGGKRDWQAPELSFTSLNHYLDLAWLYEAYRRTRKDGAPGVDGQTAEAYAEHLEDNLRDLLERAKSGRYRAPAVKRTYVPKGDGLT